MKHYALEQMNKNCEYELFEVMWVKEMTVLKEGKRVEYTDSCGLGWYMTFRKPVRVTEVDDNMAITLMSKLNRGWE